MKIIKTISYYDLLNMVKNNEYPSVYYNCSNGCKIIYVPEFDDVDNSFLCYMLKNNKEHNEEYARYYLVENILESEMFENNLEIIEDTPKEERNINVCGALFTKSEYDELAKSKEDKKIEKLSTWYSISDTRTDSMSEYLDFNNEHFYNKINELVRKVNGE